MRQTPLRGIDGGRQRCDTCGHPRKEHISQLGCSVPKCRCVDYMMLPPETAAPQRTRT
jgi:hypothetical protein